MEAATSLIEVEVRTSAASTSTTAEEVGEDVIKVHVVESTVTTLLTLALFVLANTLLALLVIDPALIRIRQSLVCKSDLLECLFGALRIVLVLVGVILDS